MIKHSASHLDHNLTPAQVGYLLNLFAGRAAFFIASVELPEELGTVPCGLHGPLMGDAPIAEAEVTRAKRGDRAWPSRLVARAPRDTRMITVIAGPHDGHACILYSTFGGPLAPQEPGDIRRQLEALEAKRGPLAQLMPNDVGEHGEIYAQIVALREKRASSDAFWAEHALSRDR